MKQLVWKTTLTKTATCLKNNIDQTATCLESNNDQNSNLFGKQH
jgi:hypothetical protein